jgi:hypothetical protein
MTACSVMCAPGARARSQQGAVFIPLWFAPGEAYQFDKSHEVVVLGGVTTTVKVAHIRLRHSRMFLVRAYPRKSQEMVFAAHNHNRPAIGRRRGVHRTVTRSQFVASVIASETADYGSNEQR